MRSLRVKLIMAFVLTSVLGIGISAFFIQQFVVREFDDYVINQRRTTFVDEARTYYSTYRSWAGVERWLAPMNNDNSPKGKSPADDLHGPNDFAGKRDAMRWFFVVVDADGRVVVPFQNYRLGQLVPPYERDQGKPVVVDAQTVGYVLTPQRGGFRNPAEEDYLARTSRALGLAAIVVMTIAVLVGIILTRLMIRPLRELTAAIQQVAGGKLQQQVPVRSRDEIGILAMQFNRMSADLARANQLRQQMTADIAHDLRTPLTVISGYLESLRDKVLKPTPERFATLYAETQILLHLVDDLHTLSLADAGELTLNRQFIIPRDLLDHVAATYQHSAEQHNVSLVVQAHEDASPINVDVEQMTRVLSNLISNALRYTPPQGQITLSSRTTETATQIIVADTGSGIDPAHLPNIFERFYRVDSSRHQETGGSGLGLAIIKSIVELHAGTITVESVPERGTTFIITLPHP